MNESRTLTVADFKELVDALQKSSTDSQYIHAMSYKHDWYSIQFQKSLMVDAAYKAYINYGDKVAPKDIVNDVMELNSEVYKKIVAGKIK